MDQNEINERNAFFELNAQQRLAGATEQRTEHPGVG